MKNQRFTVFTNEGQAHIYLKPNMPEPLVNEELTKKFGKLWLYADYNTNQIFNPMSKHKFGGLTGLNRSLKKATVTVRKGAESAYDLTKPKVVKAAKNAGKTIVPVVKSAGSSIFTATKNAGKYIWDAAEEVAPDVFDAGKSAGKRLAKETADFTTDITNYGLTKFEQYQKYKLLQTAQAKKEFNDVMKKFKAGLLKKDGVEVTEFRKALKIAVEKSFDTDEKMMRSLAKGERGMIVFNKFDIPDEETYLYGKKIKMNYPKIWAIDGNIFGNTMFNNLEKVVKRGYWLDSEEPIYKKWKSGVKRYSKNKRLGGKLTLLKWMSWGDNGRGNTELLIDNAIAKLYHHQYGKGGTIIDLAPLSEVPLSTQLQRHTGDSYNVHNFENESGEGLDAAPGNVIVHKESGKKFRVPSADVIPNGKGGFDYPSAKEKIAKSVDLITLPKNVEGTNCGNCMFAKLMDKADGVFMCNNPKIQLVVTDRMCCALWDNKGATRQWVKYEKGGSVAYDPFEEKKQWAKNKKWIAATLANDEKSSDQELENYFVIEGLSEAEAKHYVSQRDKFLKGACPCSLKKYEEGGDILPGGKGDNTADEEFDPKELEEGTKHEMEHTTNPEIAKEIAKDHLTEMPDYYEQLNLMEGNVPEPDVINISDEDAEFPSNDEAQARINSIPNGEDFYLNGKDVSTWNETDLQNYINFIRSHARDQYQEKYDNANDEKSRGEFIDFVQDTKNDLVHDDMIIIALVPCESFTEVTKVLAKTGYLIPTNKYGSGGITIQQIGNNKHKLTKVYRLEGKYNGQEYTTVFNIYFVPETQPEVSKSSKYKFNYKPIDSEILTVSDGQRFIPESKIDPELLEEIKKDIEHFRLTKADASEWQKFKEGGKVPNYTFAEQKEIGAKILKQIGAGTLMNIGAHNYGVGENDKGFPYIQFKASGEAYKRGLYITVYYNPLDWYIVDGITLINYKRKDVGHYDMVYNDQLSEIVNQIANGKKYNEGGMTIDEFATAFDSWRSSPSYNDAIIKLNNENIDYLNWTDVDIFKWALKDQEEFRKGGEVRHETEVFLPERKNKVYDHYSENEEPKYKVGKKVFMAYNARAISGIIDSITTKHDKEWGYKHIYSFREFDNPGKIRIDINSFYEDEMFPSMEELRKNVMHYTAQLTEDEMYGKGGKVLDNYRTELEAMTDEQLEEEIYEQKGIEVTIEEDDRDEYIDDLVSDYKRTLKSRGEKMKKGGLTGEKRYAVFLSTEITGDNYDEPNYETNDLTSALNWAKKKSTESAPEKPKDFEYSDYDYAADVFDTYAQTIIADFYQGESNYIDRQKVSYPKKYYKKQGLNDWMGEKEVGLYYSPKTGATDDLMKVIEAYYPNANIDAVKSFIKNLSEDRDEITDDPIPVSYETHRKEYSEWVKNTKELAPTKLAAKLALNLWHMKPSASFPEIEAKEFYQKYAVGGLTEGPSHKEGGIPMTVKSTGQEIEVEGGELIINKTNIASPKKYIITKPLTPKQIGSCINELGGNGVNVRDENSPCPIVEVDKNTIE